jgi:hypothetical protein
MEIIIRRRDIYVVAVFLTVFFSWVAYATYENFDARASLRELAQGHVDEWFETEPEGTKREDYEYLAIVDMDRPYELFGPTFGVVHVYIRDRGDVACDTFKGIEYYYNMEKEGWDMEHSAGCAAKEHHVRAFQNYLAQGAGVNDSVIDKAVGINFDVAQAEAYLKARKEGRNPFLAGHDHSHGRDHLSDHGHDHTAPRETMRQLQGGQGIPSDREQPPLGPYEKREIKRLKQRAAEAAKEETAS